MIAADRPSSMLAQVAILVGLVALVFVTALLLGDVKLPHRRRHRGDRR